MSLRAQQRRRRAGGRMRARAIELPGTPDLLDYYEPNAGTFFEHRGGGIAGAGIALRIEIPAGAGQPERAARAVAEALGSIQTGDGPGPVAVGALPFDGTNASAVLVVPHIAVLRRGARTWMIVCGAHGTPEPEVMPHAPLPEPWESLRVSSERPPQTYEAAVARAVARIADGRLRKVVLARTLLATSDHDFDVPALLDRLRAVEPDGYVFGVPGFLGASPELLVSRAGDAVRSVPLAGTAARAADPTGDQAVARALLASAKDRDEHAVVVEAVRASLGEVCDALTVDPEPHAVATSRVWHLATEARGTLRGNESALALAARLHPTPAVCGTPREAARATIAELEGLDRGLYAGIVGWSDLAGDGEWAVALRCASVEGNRARLFAGAGIVAGSDPAAELAETDAKFRALLEALRYA